VFKWNQVILNLPRDENYDPGLPCVYKVKEDGTPAADFCFYVDDNQTAGNNQNKAWLAARRVASVCSHLGIQDASQKRRKASQSPGAWAGALVSTDNAGLSQEKWEKAQSMIAATVAEVEECDEWMDRKLWSVTEGSNFM
jgi:hypothetical protein